LTELIFFFYFSDKSRANSKATVYQFGLFVCEPDERRLPIRRIVRTGFDRGRRPPICTVESTGEALPKGGKREKLSGIRGESRGH